MATQSPNLGLTLPIGSENVSRQIINDNNLIIDGAVESNSEALAIVINGDTAPKAITSGQYLFIKNHTTLPTGGYHATANIANGAAVTSSNVAQDADGIANALNGNITPVLVTVTAETGVTISSQNVYRIGKIVLVNIQITIGNSTISNTGTMVKGFPAPLQSVPLSGHRNQVGGSSQAVLSTGGNLNNDWDEFLASKKYHFNFAYACQ